MDRVPSTDVVAGSEPALLWQHFSAFTRIARPSGGEQGMTDYIVAWAVRHGFTTAHDQARNLCVWVPASPGHEHVEPLVLQAHLDMVCERRPGSEYDPRQGRIHVVRQEIAGRDWLVADETTLGADNGIGVAAALAAAEDPASRHGPLELLFTVEEETTMSGALGLEPKLVRGQRLINLDGEADDVLLVGCAGGVDHNIRWARPRASLPPGWSCWTVKVRGLSGGHSGLEIHTDRLNAIRALARVLDIAAVGLPQRLVSVSGGNASNAIPRECEAVIGLPEADSAVFQAGLVRARDELVRHYQDREKGLIVDVQPVEGRAAAFSEADSRALLDMVLGIPTGVVAMSQAIAGLVETSNNLGVIACEAGLIRLVSSTRCSHDPGLDDVSATLAALARQAGADIEPVSRYPGWRPAVTSPLLVVAKEVHRRVLGCEPLVLAVHAGLECGAIAAAIPGMDMVSFGPAITGTHAPGERVCVPSVARFYTLLLAVLAELAGGR
jgi:dipeptidase D